MHKILTKETIHNSLDIKHNWEQEMNTIISDEKWEQACRDEHKLTNSPVRKEFKWKIKMRYFRTPLSATLPTCAGGAVAWWETIHIYFGTVQNYLHIGLKYKKKFNRS